MDDPRIVLADIRDDALRVDEVLSAVADPAAGGVALFVGVVRDHDQRRDVSGLSYSAHPSAVDELQQAAASVLTDDVSKVAVIHRVGDLQVGNLAVVVAVSAPHRAAALETCRALIDRLKQTVPIWKHQRFTDGTDEWVGL